MFENYYRFIIDLYEFRKSIEFKCIVNNLTRGREKASRGEGIKGSDIYC